MKYSIGDIVKNILPLESENGTSIPPDTHLRIVAIAPKVRMVAKDNYHDNSPYFFNAVLADQTNDYSNRIRANFCTIKKLPLDK